MTNPAEGRFLALPDLDPKNYSRSSLHSDTCVWVEKNCYVDLWIEVLHSLGLEPAAALAMSIAVDFEGDQWTFFKPSHDELRELYGIDVQELTIWRSLLSHAQEHLGAGKLISTEADAFWLPDTAGTDYRRQHTKTTIVLANIDVPAEQLGYFHNTGYFELEGEDFRQLFRLDQPQDPTFLPLYAELVRIDRRRSLPAGDLCRLASGYLQRQLVRLPAENPLRKFQKRFERELPAMQAGNLGTYHLWAFANIRQLGAAMELAAAFIKWMRPEPQYSVDLAASAFDQISQGSKTLILKAARAVNSKRALDVGPLFDDMAAAWESAICEAKKTVRA